MPNDTLVVDLFLDAATTPIAAMGVDLSYDPSIMTFLDCERGGLVTDWSEFAWTDLGSWIRVTGTNSEPIPTGSPGTLARVWFLVDVCDVSEPGSVNLCPENLTQDLEFVTPTCQTLAYDVFEGDGDLTNDGQVSPQDALCVFNAYMSFPNPPAAECAPNGWDVKSDVDCSGDITPGDALCVFDHWLDGSCVFCGGSSVAFGPVAVSGAGVAVSIGDIADNDDVLLIPVHVEGMLEMRACGMCI